MVFAALLLSLATAVASPPSVVEQMEALPVRSPVDYADESWVVYGRVSGRSMIQLGRHKVDVFGIEVLRTLRGAGPQKFQVRSLEPAMSLHEGQRVVLTLRPDPMPDQVNVYRPVDPSAVIVETAIDGILAAGKLIEIDRKGRAKKSKWTPPSPDDERLPFRLVDEPSRSEWEDIVHAQTTQIPRAALGPAKVQSIEEAVRRLQPALAP